MTSYNVKNETGLENRRDNEDLLDIVVKLKKMEEFWRYSMKGQGAACVAYYRVPVNFMVDHVSDLNQIAKSLTEIISNK